ncbi:methylated-DNA--[protein]-cysteine S-methyltransferase [Cohnella sp. JJ-181]|uniref:methylated-DNA--[protein]-cysteine S-methyltransferase n=1 Tax=Cohnella rhizoplanae TaxID=2974897 RepID=UPI0022FFA5E7|nr:methylated-DNA--[protein]-cysteine S-methyltransferase [Cohnella sp. JJ-181]CAI6087615.1 Methylated-DNA--protein-cysteine methyltransferase, inducible [Cohnella sp. JJ-181]
MTDMDKKTLVRWSRIEHGDWRLHIAATDRGLCYIGSPDMPLSQLEAWVGARMAGSDLVRDDARLAPYAHELAEYMDGARRTFEAPVDFRGTAFQLAVWQALTDIPYGETRSYSDIANVVARPAAVRAVGAAIGANPVLVCVPCHRVVGKSGAMTGYRGGLDMKIRLLELERGANAAAPEQAGTARTR